MTRRFLTVAAVLTLCGTSIWAAEQATFVLNNGQRQSGTIVYGRGDNNIVDGRFHLSVPGNELTFGLDDVAVIDFAGGTPTAGERQALPADTTGLMVMRNGSVQRGHLHNMIGGDLVQWVNEAGQRNNYPIRDVSRLYLNPRAARSVFLDSLQPAAPAAPPASGPRTVRVNANQQWTETGIAVRQGDRVMFNATGQVTIARNANPIGPGGMPSSIGRPRSLGGASAGALIGSVNGVSFPIGADAQPIVMPANGTLMLGVNDDRFDDNAGFFNVVVTPPSGSTDAPNPRNRRGFGRQ